ncbi:DNA polymerase III subunit chi [Ralstonia pseudosolanacearum]|nr:DNA polymerase III subunit chi [Ralstonia pseudosolanacearum]
MPGKLAYACRLVRKAYGAGQKVIVVGNRAALEAFDAQLWTFSQLDFLPHCGLRHRLAAQTPILLADASEPLDDAPHHDILVNLSDATPPLFARFARLIEIVGDDEAERAAARDRFRFYRDRGYPIQHHDVGRA